MWGIIVELKELSKTDQTSQFIDCETLTKQFYWLVYYLTKKIKNLHVPKEEISTLIHSFESNPQNDNFLIQIDKLFAHAGIQPASWLDVPDQSSLPVLSFSPELGIALVYGRSSDGYWLVESPSGKFRYANWPENTLFTAVHSFHKLSEASSARQALLGVLKENHKWIYPCILASLIGSSLALVTSLYSMQIYDRVIGSHSLDTLLVLTIGVVIAYLIDLPVKMARAGIVDNAAAAIDQKCATLIYARLLSVRLDQYPGTVGSLAAQVKSYESVRSFAMALILFLTTDAPFALLFVVVIGLIGGLKVAMVPLFFLFVSFAVGLMSKKMILSSVHNNVLSGNKRHGLLVETIEGAETMKATGNKWRFLGKWNELSAHSIKEFIITKHLNDRSSYLTAFIQQLSYVLLIATGAWIATTSTDITSGSLVACSILSSRVLSPMALIPGLLVQWAHAKTALTQLESLFKLQPEYIQGQNLIIPERLYGKLQLNDIEFRYPGQNEAMSIDVLNIKPGEKVAILGGIGTGKSTLLRAIAGLSKPVHGKVLLDDMDIMQISPERRSELVGYLPQSFSLFSGTLKDNLTAGLGNLSDKFILDISRITGLSHLINSRDAGLNLPIFEGGGGLSGGQRQLVGLTRLLMQSPSFWLLDEPTSSMDITTENRCINIFKQAIKPEQTLILVTHKLSLLSLVERVIVLSPSGIVLDGPKDEVMDKLKKPTEFVS